MARFTSNSTRLFVSFLTILLLLSFDRHVSGAQGTALTIAVGENKTGELVAATGSVGYALSATTPQNVNIQVLALTPGLAPTFRLLDATGIVLLVGDNHGTQTFSRGSASLFSAGVYTIAVQSANQAAGQYVLSVQAGGEMTPPEGLILGQTVTGAVSLSASTRLYQFTAASDSALLVSVRAQSMDAAPVVALRDAGTNELLGLDSSRIAGVVYRLGPGQDQYLIEVRYGGGTSAQNFTVCLASELDAGMCSSAVVNVTTIIPPVMVPTPQLPPPTAAIPTQSPTIIDPNGPCQVASAHGSSINVRSGPGMSYSIIGQLLSTMTAPVIGRAADNSWFQVNVNGLLGWVSAAVVTLGGNCGGVAVVTLPTVAPPPLVPTTNPPQQPTVQQPGSPPTTVPTDTPEFVIIDPNALQIVPGFQPVSQKLDYSAQPNYGNANLSAGFSPDPYSVGLTSGGQVDVSYLGGGCTGFATSSSDLRINFSGGGPLLRIYFVGTNGDAAMVVNDPYGNNYCVDDSFGTVNPTIDFNNPAGGSYDVWLTSLAVNTFVSGTVYVTASNGNHP